MKKFCQRPNLCLVISKIKYLSLKDVEYLTKIKVIMKNMCKNTKQWQLYLLGCFGSITFGQITGSYGLSLTIPNETKKTRSFIGSSPRVNKQSILNVFDSEFYPQVEVLSASKSVIQTVARMLYILLYKLSVVIKFLFVVTLIRQLLLLYCHIVSQSY